LLKNLQNVDNKMDAATLDILIRASLVLLGAGLGIFLKIYYDQVCLLRLCPLILEQTQIAALKGTEAFCMADAELVEALLEKVDDHFSKKISFGIDVSGKWKKGMMFLANTHRAGQEVISAQSEEARIDALSELRSSASELLHWSKEAETQGHRMR
jgi:hypothetical protein